jgi:hypothetical protein
MIKAGRESIKNERIDFLNKASETTANKEYSTEGEKARNDGLRKELEL